MLWTYMQQGCVVFLKVAAERLRVDQPSLPVLWVLVKSRVKVKISSMFIQLFCKFSVLTGWNDDLIWMR